MLKRLSVVLVGAALAFPLAQLPAEAASTQKICSSKSSKVEFDLIYSPNKVDPVQIGRCYDTVPKGTLVDMSGVEAYKVGYGGDYSECRIGKGTFKPYQKANNIYFKTYYNRLCY